MLRPRFRPTLIIMLAAWLCSIAIVLYTLVSSELTRWEAKFALDARLLLNDVKQKLDTNEAVLAGISAFLEAVDRNDTDATIRYAASASSAYPHIYMIEIARKLDVANEAAFEATLRKTWRPDFAIKDFSEVTGRNLQDDSVKKVTWPVLFMYPSLPEAQAIYGVRLETVDFLSRTVALAQRNIYPLASPVFRMYEGDDAYILLQEVNRPAGKSPPGLSFFGDTMMAMVLIKTKALIPPRLARDPDYARLSVSASIVSPGKHETLLFEQKAPEAGRFERLIFPEFSQQLSIDNASQPTLMRFVRQLHWHDVLQPEKIMTLLLLTASMILVPWVTLRNHLCHTQAEVEHERSAYLATHDQITNLPNRFLFADRFEHALHTWQRNGQSFALMLADLDHFKEVNDRHGHDAGDQVLVACANRLVAELRSCDTVARHGGDEFIILLANVETPDDARNVAMKLLAAISEPIETTAGPVQLSCSIGIAICPLHGVNLNALRKATDLARYHSKDSGRNAISVFRASSAEQTA